MHMTPRKHTVRLDDIIEYIARIDFAEQQLLKYEQSNYLDCEMF